MAPYDPRYLAGVRLFNEGDYFLAHECWEDLWSQSQGPARRFYQGLIQAAVGLCHFHNGNLAGAVKLYHSARDYMAGCPTPFLGLDVPGFWQSMERCFAPLLSGSAPDRSLRPEEGLLPRIELVPQPEAWPDPEEFISEEGP